MITCNMNALMFNMKQKFGYVEIRIIYGKIRIKTKPNKPLLSVWCRQQLKGCKPAPENLITI